MLPSEMIILLAIAISKNGGRALLTRPMDITGEYIGYLYSSLVTRGYLERHGATRYRLTPAGKKAVSEFLSKNGNGAKDIIKRLRLLGIDVSLDEEQKAGRLKKQIIGVR